MMEELEVVVVLDGPRGRSSFASRIVLISLSYMERA
jgi:hypothetical protein